MAQQLLNAIVLGSILTLFSVGLSLAWGTLDVLNLAHGALFVFAGYLVFELSNASSLPLIPTLLIALIGAGLAAMAIELIAFRRIRTKFVNRRHAELAMLIASLGASTVITQFVADQTGSQIFAAREGFFTTNVYEVLGLRISNIQIAIVVTALVVAFLLDFWIRRSRQGRAIRSVAFDPGTSSLLGIDVNRLAAGTMFLSGALAGLAGVLLSLNTAGQDTSIGHQYLLTAFAILIVGGVGSLRGAVVAAYSIALVQTAVVAYGPGNYRDGVAFLLILIVLLVRPQGLFARPRTNRA